MILWIQEIIINSMMMASIMFEKNPSTWECLIMYLSTFTDVIIALYN